MIERDDPGAVPTPAKGTFPEKVPLESSKTLKRDFA